MNQVQQPNPVFHSVDPKSLVPHPSYLSIYGEEEDLSDVMILIGNQQYPRPLLINSENIIVNGYLYWKAAIALNWKAIPVEIREFPNLEAELELLLLENRERKKTNEQKVREALAWEGIEKVKAKQRKKLAAFITNQKLGRGVNESVREDLSLTTTFGKTRDRVANIVGLGSGRTYAKAKKIITKIDNLVEEGDVESANDLRKTLNEQSIDAASKLLRRGKDESAEIPSCWNCKYCSGERLGENHEFYCNKFGSLSFLEKDGRAYASSCSEWKYRFAEDVDKVEKALPYFSFTLPSYLKPMIEDAAKASGMIPVDWIVNCLLQAIDNRQ